MWDPLEPVVTRPLALVQDASLYCYGTDFNKNVTEVFDGQGAVAAAYDYSPYGQVVSTGDLVQPVQWSSEMNNGELALVYYNYRYYNPADGRWINRDPIAEEGSWNLYGFVRNSLNVDNLGLIPPYNGPTTGTTGYISDTQIGMINGGKTPGEAMDQTTMSVEEIITGLDIALGIVLNTLYNCKNKKNTKENEKDCNKCCLAWMTLMIANTERSFVSWSIKCNKLKSPKLVVPCIAGCIGKKIYTLMRIKSRYNECIEGCKCKEIENSN